MTRRKQLGALLVEADLLTPDQLQKALQEHKKTGLKLGQYLIREGIVSEGAVIDLISRQLGIERYLPDRFPVDTELAALISPDVALKYSCVPLQKRSRLLVVATPDPMDIDTLDSIELLTNLEVEPVICSERELDHLFTTIYGMHTTLGGVLEEMEEMEVNAQPDHADEAGIDEGQVTSLQDMAEDAPVVRLVNSILAQAVREGASDIHISPEQKGITLRFRIDGKLHEMPAPPKSMMLPIISRIKILADMDISVLRVPQDGRFTVKMEKREVNVRASTLPTIYGENVVLRLFDMSSAHFTLDRLGMVEGDRDKIQRAIRQPYGMILSTGPTGSGKSTSLYAILREINKPDINIITLEDPVEYRVAKIRQTQLNRKAGMTFASGLRAILRQDPDVIMVGEIRDHETANIAVRAALTGHRVLSTIHTNDAAGAITRLVDMGIEPFLVSSVILVAFAQRLIRRICPYCKEAYDPPARVLAQFGLQRSDQIRFQRGRGCFNCMNTGYKGRTGIFEVLEVDRTIQEMILRRQSAQEIGYAAQQSGTLRTLRDDAIDKVKQGITTLEEAASAVLV